MDVLLGGGLVIFGVFVGAMIHSSGTIQARKSKSNDDFEE